MIDKAVDAAEVLRDLVDHRGNALVVEHVVHIGVGTVAGLLLDVDDRLIQLRLERLAGADDHLCALAGELCRDALAEAGRAGHTNNDLILQTQIHDMFLLIC